MPARASEDHEIAGAVGVLAMTVLCAEFGLKRVELPVRRRTNKPRILAALKAGSSVQDIARQVGCTEAYVRMLSSKAGVRRDKPQR